MASAADTVGDGDQCSSFGARSGHHGRLPGDLNVESEEKSGAEKD